MANFYLTFGELFFLRVTEYNHIVYAYEGSDNIVYAKLVVYNYNYRVKK